LSVSLVSRLPRNTTQWSGNGGIDRSPLLEYGHVEEDEGGAALVVHLLGSLDGVELAEDGAHVDVDVVLQQDLLGPPP
jgi:hypothetical protein